MAAMPEWFVWTSGAELGEAVLVARGAAGWTQGELARRARVTLVPNGDLRERVTPAWVAGQAFSTDVIFVFPGRISSYPHDSVESVVRHELVHLALNVRAQDRPLPRWLTNSRASQRSPTSRGRPRCR